LRKKIRFEFGGDLGIVLRSKKMRGALEGFLKG
jgi:hypothetical protein